MGLLLLKNLTNYCSNKNTGAVKDVTSTEEEAAKNNFNSETRIELDEVVIKP